MIYEFNSVTDLWAQLPNVKKWRYIHLPNGHVAANLMWRDEYQTELSPMANTSEAIRLYPALEKL